MSGSSLQQIRYIGATASQAIDADLMSASGAFSIDQLMELAGLACARTVYRCYPPSRHPNVLVACGPGNQGGDGLVAARHLHHYGYRPTVWYPKPGKTELFQRLRKQLENLHLAFTPVDEFESTFSSTDVVLDTIFGFSFTGEPRDPFREPLEAFKQRNAVKTPVVSVDIPSGWNVETGNSGDRFFTPDVLLSLTAPKSGARNFHGRHFLGGRFVPGDIERKYALALPIYPDSDDIVEITGAREISEEDAKKVSSTQL